MWILQTIQICGVTVFLASAGSMKPLTKQTYSLTAMPRLLLNCDATIADLQVGSDGRQWKQLIYVEHKPTFSNKCERRPVDTNSSEIFWAIPIEYSR